MTTVSVSAPLTTASVESLLQTLFERFETIRLQQPKMMRVPMQAEIRSLDFWRAIVAECLASFFLIFIICGAFIPWSGHTPPSIGIALAAGFAVASLTLCFAHVSGAHLNPVVTLALLVTRKISPMKAFLFITSQAGGAIAGSALLYGVTSNGHQGNLGATVISAGLSEWQALGIELSLTFVLVLVYLTTMDDHRKTLSASIGPGPLTFGLTYTACSFVALPSTGASFNPMRSLGPAFVMNKWDAHWVYWLGPIVGGCLAGILYEFIFNPFRSSKRRKGSIDGDSSSVHSDEDNYDDIKSTVQNYHSARMQHYDQYRPAMNPEGPSNPSSPNGVAGTNWRNRMERAESVYGGTKSLYCKSPGVTRASLNRSQSVYAKPPSPALPVNSYPARGPLQSAQSTYLARNVDLIRTESIYAARPSAIPVNRSESMYGQGKGTRHVSELVSGGRDLRSPREPAREPPREPIYGTSGPSSDYTNRCKPESYQMEPVYGTRRDIESVAPPNRTDNPYNRKPTNYRQDSSAYSMIPARQEIADTSNTAPLSPSDTSKDSAYGSVHGASMQNSSATEWHNSSQEQRTDNQINYPPTTSYNPAPAHQSMHAQGSAGQPSFAHQNAHLYAQKFRPDLVSPGNQQSPSPGAFHSPVQY